MQRMYTSRQHNIDSPLFCTSAILRQNGNTEIPHQYQFSIAWYYHDEGLGLCALKLSILHSKHIHVLPKVMGVAHQSVIQTGVNRSTEYAISLNGLMYLILKETNQSLCTSKLYSCESILRECLRSNVLYSPKFQALYLIVFLISIHAILLGMCYWQILHETSQLSVK